MKAIILVTLEITQCALIAREVKENQMTIKKANNHIQRLTAGLNLEGDKALRKQRVSDRKRRRGHSAIQKCAYL